MRTYAFAYKAGKLFLKTCLLVGKANKKPVHCSRPLLSLLAIGIPGALITEAQTTRLSLTLKARKGKEQS